MAPQWLIKPPSQFVCTLLAESRILVLKFSYGSSITSCIITFSPKLYTRARATLTSSTSWWLMFSCWWTMLEIRIWYCWFSRFVLCAKASTSCNCCSSHAATIIRRSKSLSPTAKSPDPSLCERDCENLYQLHLLFVPSWWNRHPLLQLLSLLSLS